MLFLYEPHKYTRIAYIYLYSLGTQFSAVNQLVRSRELVSCH